MDKKSRIAKGVVICVLLMGLSNESNGTSVDSSIPLDEVLKTMTQEFSGQYARTAFERTRYPVSLTDNPGRSAMQSFIKFKFSGILGMAGGREQGHVLHETPFSTTIRIGKKDTQVTGINYMAVLSQKENNTYEDRPLVLLANYDTDIKEINPTEENGSGVAALLVIGSKLANEIQSGRLQLKHSIILAATDTSLNKYATDGSPVDAYTGSDILADKFLPEYLTSRPKGIRGVIVLDNLMNYQEIDRSQSVAEMDRSYPEAYAEMSATNFSGDFVALVARGDDLDKQLVEAIVENWRETQKYRQSGSQVPITTRLIKFIHEVNRGQGEGYVHFLKSDQTSFWNHKSEIVPPYPAVLLTDTRTLRSPVCRDRCDYFGQTTATKNLEFVHRTIQTVYQTTVNLQSVATGLVSSMLTINLVLISFILYFCN